MAISDWSATALCQDKDLLEFEGQVLVWTRDKGTAQKWISKAKDLIATRLRYSFRDVELATDAADVLDLIADVTPLKDAACYLSLHLLCHECSVGGDYFESLEQMYWHKFEKEIPRALGLVSLDLDESGVIETSEKYNVKTGVTFVRGS
ncbi:MAG: hypothetical protein KOO61_09330 [Spirochaetales bacterium]|nr:hypothetical protein [Spirochaetales bacterium]